MVGPVIKRSRTARGCAGIYSPEQCRSFAFEVESGDSLRFIIRRDPSTGRFLLALITRSAVSTTAITVLLCGGGERAGLASDYRSVGQGWRGDLKRMTGSGSSPVGAVGDQKNNRCPGLRLIGDIDQLSTCHSVSAFGSEGENRSLITSDRDNPALTQPCLRPWHDL